MTCHTLPKVFRITAALAITAIVMGGWWQRQPVGGNGAAFLTIVSYACPAAMPSGRHPTVADTAHLLDRWGYALLGNLLSRDGRDRCATGAAR